MNPRPLSALPAVLLSLLFISVPLTVAADNDSLFDCRVSVDGAKFDLTQLAGEHTINKTRELPPSTMVDSLRFDLCEDLKKLDKVADRDQCKTGTRACLSQINKKDDDPERVISVIPIVQSSSINPSYSAGQDSSKFLTIVFKGPEYPNPITTTPTTQSFNLTLLCDPEGNEDPVFKSYDGAQVQVEWKTKAGCPSKEGSDGGKGGDSDDKNPPKDKDENNSRSAGSGIGWFFLMLLLAFAAYFGLGAYYNYSNYGARGTDLIPHRDFWKEVPYMLRDVVSHLCSSVRSRRPANRGYIAV
ncbi:autophagy-related protein 27 [Collybia nuda]|uniref:Autophagy-related protein 27 n=1 Tax=Collybia nuda TaxID=64659 RepID=A0A9P5Y678_9AGAR|nr:autophagy-related protein 27 [Collybia nuda]